MHLFWLSHTGFGINTNILETNVLNLGVVIAFVVVNLGKAFGEAFNTRRERVLKAMTRAEERYKQSQFLLKEAKINFAKVKYKASRIRSNGRVYLKRLHIILLELARYKQRRLRKSEYDKYFIFEKEEFAFMQIDLVECIYEKAHNKIIRQLQDDKNLQNQVTLDSIARLFTNIKYLKEKKL